MSAAAAGLNIVNSAELARLNYLLNHLHISVKTGLEAYGNNFAALLFCLADSDSLIKSNRHRFFKKHRKTMLKRVNGALRMGAVVGADRYGVKVHGVNHFLVIGEGFSLYAVILEKLFSLSGDKIGAGYYLNIGLLFVACNV